MTQPVPGGARGRRAVVALLTTAPLALLTLVYATAAAGGTPRVNQTLTPTVQVSTTQSTNYSPQSMQEVSAHAAQLTSATTASGRWSLVPQRVRTQFPQLQSIVQDGSVSAVNSLINSTRQAPAPPAIHLGDAIPGCPARGQELLTGLPAPYGNWPTNPLNNWCLPNGEDNGCTGLLDRAFYFDFRAACRQHDLGYRFTPTARSSVDLQFFSDMLKDCRYRNLAGAALCGAQAAIYYDGVVLLGGLLYGSGTVPGYDSPGAAAIPTAPSCAQSTHVWIANGESMSVPRANTIYPTGVVRSLSRVLFTFKRNGVTVLEQLTYFSDAGCVVRHEREALNTGLLTTGSYQVSVTYTKWENHQVVTQPLYTLQITPATSGPCGQPTHVWIAGAEPMALVRGGIIWPTGVVAPFSRITFTFRNSNNAVVLTHVTQPAGSNCVVAHEPEAMSTSVLPLGYVPVDATYTEWESGLTVTVQLIIMTLTT